MKSFRQSDGFTLVEVIISIAILSIASVVALQLFITSQNLNTTSRHSDIASVQSTNMIEGIRTCDSADALISNVKNMIKSENGYKSEIYLDSYFTAQEDSATDSAYLLVSDLSEVETGLYDVLVTVTDLADQTILASYKTSHYFKKEVSADVAQ